MTKSKYIEEKIPKTEIKQRNKFNIDEDLDQSFNIKQFARAIIYVKRHAKKLLVAFIFSIATMLLGLLMPLFTRTVVDDLIPAKDIPGIFKMSGLFLLTVLLLLFCSRMKAVLITKSGQHIIAEIRHDLFSHLQKLPFDYYDSRPHGKILVRVVNYVNAVADFLSNGIVNIIIELISIIAILFFMFALDPRLTLVALSGLPIFVLFIVFIKGPQRRAQRRFSNKQSNLNAYLQESISGMKITQAFCREDVNYGIFEALSEESRKAHNTSAYIGATIWPVILLLSNVVAALVYMSVGLDFITGVTVGTLLAFVGYVWRLWQPIQSLGNLFNTLITTTAYLERIFQLLDEPISIDDKPNAVALPAITGKVVFDEVLFGYEPTVVVLDHVSFTAEAGESIALVGPTGSGKSTIVSLLARFYDIQGGSIKIDGYELGDVTISSLRSQMGIMLQDTFLFTGSIMENIRYGRLDATDEEVIAAAKAVHADDFISNLPNGYDTPISERGQSLSAGQRQLISFARTLLSDPKILILDEATSSIDTKTELLVQEGLNALLKGRTSFIIAHRLSTIKNCRILYIMDGKIAESGYHDELIAKKGFYYDLYTSQLAGD